MLEQVTKLTIPLTHRHHVLTKGIVCCHCSLVHGRIVDIKVTLRWTFLIICRAQDFVALNSIISCQNSWMLLYVWLNHLGLLLMYLREVDLLSVLFGWNNFIISLFLCISMLHEQVLYLIICQLFLSILLQLAPVLLLVDMVIGAVEVLSFDFDASMVQLLLLKMLPL